MYSFCAALMKRVFNSNNDMVMNIQDVLECKNIFIFFLFGFPHKIKT